MAESLGPDGQKAYLKDLGADARKDLAAFMTRVGIGQAEKVVLPGETAVANEILKAAEVLKADLIFVATQGKGAVARMALGSVAQQVLIDARCDVLTFPPLSPGEAA